jgi:hypothetical protein
MTCRDLTEFMSNTTEFSHLGMKYQRAGPERVKWDMRHQESADVYQVRLDRIVARSNDLKFLE